ncbi:MAG: hypothetical protein FJ125_15060, partial [Deltaproteobacteria bacterium]|nr:hypothetical protein [Deltaproteobacteria bacterium]
MTARTHSWTIASVSAPTASTKRPEATSLAASRLRSVFSCPVRGGDAFQGVNSTGIARVSAASGRHGA